MINIWQNIFLNMVKDGIEFGAGVGLEHSDASGTEIADALEQRRGSQVASDVQNATVLVDTVDALINLTAHEGHLLGTSDLGDRKSVV